MSRMELGVNEKLHQLKTNINRISKAILLKEDPTANHVF